ncbi:hypothetical protein PQQ86_25910 [Paraburkholderia sediminicola]|uniref:hypothetical protein n=1 Tax=Paraburkholderia sediminicola TaxID=458836 RepID=UPI0038B7D34B
MAIVSYCAKLVEVALIAAPERRSSPHTYNPLSIDFVAEALKLLQLASVIRGL